MMTETTAPIYTDAEALDEAVLRLVRKLSYRHLEALNEVLAKLPQGARDALSAAERRADQVRFADEKRGIKLCTRPYPDPLAYLDEDED